MATQTMAISQQETTSGVPLQSQPQAHSVIELEQSSYCSGQNTRSVVSATNAAPLSHKMIFKLLSAGFSFFVAGTIDGSLGTLIPYIIQNYNIGTSFLSIIFAASFLGWLLAAATNNHMMKYLDTGAILTIGAFLQLISNILRVWNPPFPLFAVTFFTVSLGMGYQDSHSNTFTSTVHGAHRWLGFIHAMYALGGLVSPFVATPVASSLQERWSLFYFFLIGLGAINLGGVILAFGDSIKMLPRQSSNSETGSLSREREAMIVIAETLKLRVVWILSLFFFFSLGVGITAGGWVVQYLVEVRHGKLSKVGYTPAGLYGGIFFGRILLVEPTHRFGPKRMVLLYCALILSLQLVFWLVPNIIANSVAISILGFFYGPMFPIGISVATKLVPNSVNASALGFIFVMAQAGGSLFPSITGFIAGSAGVQILQPILVGLIVAMGISWLLVPKVARHSD